MPKDQAEQKSISLYPKHQAYIRKLKAERDIPGHGFSRTLQLIIEEHETLTATKKRINARYAEIYPIAE